MIASIWPLLFLTFLSFLRKYLYTHTHTNARENNHREYRTRNDPSDITRRRGDRSPELALGANLVGCPELHAVDLGLLITGRRQRATDHLVLMELHTHTHTHGDESKTRIKRMEDECVQNTNARKTRLTLKAPLPASSSKPLT